MTKFTEKDGNFVPGKKEDFKTPTVADLAASKKTTEKAEKAPAKPATAAKETPPAAKKD